MKINPNFNAFNISAKGMGAQKKKMDLIAENIANTETTKTENGTPYKRKYLIIEENESFQQRFFTESNNLSLRVTNQNHIAAPVKTSNLNPKEDIGISAEVLQDNTTGTRVLMPEHPDADSDGYVEMPNVNVVTEMVDMIAATRSYEANLTAFNASKQIAKDSLEI
jgi:flagellar basal-body rod protein FlgC